MTATFKPEKQEGILYAEDLAVTESLYETDRYFLQLGRPISAEPGKATAPVVQLVNKEYGTIEGEAYSITEGIFTMAQRTITLETYEENLKSGFPDFELPPDGGTVH